MKQVIKNLKKKYPIKCKSYDKDCFTCRVYKCIETLQEIIDLEDFAKKKGWDK